MVQVERPSTLETRLDDLVNPPVESNEARTPRQGESVQVHAGPGSGETQLGIKLSTVIQDLVSSTVYLLIRNSSRAVGAGQFAVALRTDRSAKPCGDCRWLPAHVIWHQVPPR